MRLDTAKRLIAKLGLPLTEGDGTDGYRVDVEGQPFQTWLTFGVRRDDTISYASVYQRVVGGHDRLNVGRLKACVAYARDRCRWVYRAGRAVCVSADHCHRTLARTLSLAVDGRGVPLTDPELAGLAEGVLAGGPEGPLLDWVEEHRPQPGPAWHGEVRDWGDGEYSAEVRPDLVGLFYADPGGHVWRVVLVHLAPPDPAFSTWRTVASALRERTPGESLEALPSVAHFLSRGVASLLVAGRLGPEHALHVNQ